jgi:hypothetical protein
MGYGSTSIRVEPATWESCLTFVLPHPGAQRLGIVCTGRLALYNGP